MVTVSKKEYEKLLEAKLRYGYLREILEEDIFAPPPTRKAREILDSLKTIKKYNTQFLKSMEKGLKRSSYFGA